MARIDKIVCDNCNAEIENLVEVSRGRFPLEMRNNLKGMMDFVIPRVDLCPDCMQIIFQYNLN